MGFDEIYILLATVIIIVRGFYALGDLDQE